VPPRQEFPQRPQCALSLDKSTQLPPHTRTLSVRTQAPLHSVVPAGQLQTPVASHTPPVGDVHAPDVRGVAVHCTAPPTHAVVPDCAHPPLPTDRQEAPTAAHAPPHGTVPDAHAHAPIEHTWPVGHTVPHAPQLLRSVMRSRQVPAQVVPHDTAHAPPTQI
jgi:hypothetical protein